jgi:hypothetical protein
MGPKPAWFAGAAAILVAIAVAAVAIPSLWAASVALPSWNSIAEMRSGRDVSRTDAAAAAAANIRAGRIFEPGRYYSDAALAAGRLPSADRARLADGTSLRRLVDDALVVGPTSPHNWARRAQLQLDAGDLAGARASLEASLLMGRFVPGLTVPRLRIILHLLQLKPDGDLDGYFVDQVRIAARNEPNKLAVFADGGAAEGRTQKILLSEFRLYDAYIRALIAKRAMDKQAR